MFYFCHKFGSLWKIESVWLTNQYSNYPKPPFLIGPNHPAQHTPVLQINGQGLCGNEYFHFGFNCDFEI